MTTAIAHPHVEVHPDGVPYVLGTETKIVEIVLWRMAHQWSVDEIHRQHEDLSLAQIHAALAYYYDHQDELDDGIQRRLRREQEILDAIEQSPLQIRARALKHSAVKARS